MGEPELVVRFTEQDAARDLRSDVRQGLTAEPKWLSPKWFYDAAGSALFERITEQPEYYQTRAEHEILSEAAVEIAERTGPGALVELGSGSSEKTRLLLDALSKHGTLGEFVPLDVSESALRDAIGALRAEYPRLHVHGIVDDFTAGLASVAVEGQRLVAFLGGTIGNLLPGERAEFLSSIRAALREGEWLLIGTDLVKAADRLVRAYDDAAGVTAEFNRNVLRVVNRELGADFVPEAFEHVASWNAEQEWIEMRLRASRPMRISVAELGLPVTFAAGEELRTEVSAKFRPEGARSELEAAGFDVDRSWQDAAGDFALWLARAR